MSVTGLSSLHVGVGSVHSNPDLRGTNQMQLAVSAAVTAAMNSASVEPSAVSNCVLDPHTIAPPECANTHPVVGCLSLRLFAWAALTKPISLPCVTGSQCCSSNDCMTAGGPDVNNSAFLLQDGQANFVPQCFVAQRCPATFFRHM